MKRFLSAGEGYGLNFPYYLTTLYITTSLFLMCLQVGLANQPFHEPNCLDYAIEFDHSDSIAIDTTTTLNHQIPAIAVGQRLPEEFWTKEFQFYDHEKVYTQTLEQYRGKPMIIDLWHIYCGSCLSSFPFLKEIGSKYDGELIILPVNSYDKDLSIIDRVLNRLGEEYKVTSVFYDDYIKNLFPHMSVPQYIWILPNGMVEAVTIKLFLTHDNVSKFMKGYDEN